MIDLAATLTVAEVDCLEDCEQRIERGLKTFVEVGTALATIRDNRLYRTEFGTFEDYCRARWDMGRDYADRMIVAAQVVPTIVGTGLPAPTKESQARELARVPEPERVGVWRETVERTGGKPTAAAIRETAAATRAAPTDLRDQVLAQLPTDSGQALTSTQVWAELTGCSMQQVGDVLAELDREGLVRSPGVQRGRGRLWYRANAPVDECDTHPDVDDQDERAGLGEDYDPDPQRRIEAVAAVAPEFVRPVDTTESPARQDPDPTGPSVATAGGPDTTQAGPTFDEVLDHLVPDDNPHGEWRRNFVKAIGGATRLMLFTPEAVAEKADQQCLDELDRLAEHFAAWRARISQAVAAGTPDNVRPLRRIS